MDHADVREQLELAAVEPGGLDRLMAGDTHDAAAVAGHLAGCDSCREEFARLRRASGIIRASVVSLPAPELRERTLAYVAALGRPRGAALEPAAATGAVPAGPEAPATSAAPGPGPAGVVPQPAARGRGGPRRLSPLLAAAAAIVLAVAGTGAAVNAMRDSDLRASQAEVAELAHVTATTQLIEQQPDAVRLALAPASGGPANGTLLFSPTSRELVIIATNLPAPAAGQEYRCWLDLGSSRERIGRMLLASGVAYWAGPVESVASATTGTRFGVSLVDVGSDTVVRDAVLSGQL